MSMFGAAAILYREDEVLIVKHGKESRHPTGLYSIPGGETKPSDRDTMDTIVREIREETGLEIDKANLDPLAHYDFDLGGKRGKRQVSVDLYACEVTDKIKTNVNLDEIRTESFETIPVWVKIEDFILGKYTITYTSGNFLEDIIKYLKRKIREQ